MNVALRSGTSTPEATELRLIYYPLNNWCSGTHWMEAIFSCGSFHQILQNWYRVAQKFIEIQSMVISLGNKIFNCREIASKLLETVGKFLYEMAFVFSKNLD